MRAPRRKGKRREAPIEYMGYRLKNGMPLDGQFLRETAIVAFIVGRMVENFRFIATMFFLGREAEKRS